MGILFLSAFTAAAERKIHNLNQIPYFASTNEIVKFFKDASVPIDILPIKQFVESNIIIAAYPYAGSDTIDVFSFVKYGDRWQVNMVYFYFKPKHRRLKITETTSTIILYDDDVEILRLTVNRELKE